MMVVDRASLEVFTARREAAGDFAADSVLYAAERWRMWEVALISGSACNGPAVTDQYVRMSGQYVCVCVLCVHPLL